MRQRGKTLAERKRQLKEHLMLEEDVTRFSSVLIDSFYWR